MRKVIMYSRTERVIGSQLDRMQIGVSSVDSSTNSTEMPSTPIL
jgi:hypothetical protein